MVSRVGSLSGGEGGRPGMWEGGRAAIGGETWSKHGTPRERGGANHFG